jgi:hypothetical protein
MKTTMADIARATAKHFNLAYADLVGEPRHQKVAKPRQLAMYLCRQHTKRSFPEIGHFFGNRDHTTVIHAMESIGDGALPSGKYAKDAETIVSMACTITSIRTSREAELVRRLHAGESVLGMTIQKVREVAMPRPADRIDRRIFSVKPAPRPSWYAQLPPSSIAAPTARRLMAGRA